jgi:hypothetical protein
MMREQSTTRYAKRPASSGEWRGYAYRRRGDIVASALASSASGGSRGVAFPCGWPGGELREAGGVATWRGEAFDNALPDRINGLRKHNVLLQWPDRNTGCGKQDVGRFSGELFGANPKLLGTAVAPSVIDLQLASFGST